MTKLPKPPEDIITRLMKCVLVENVSELTDDREKIVKILFHSSLVSGLTISEIQVQASSISTERILDLLVELGGYGVVTTAFGDKPAYTLTMAFHSVAKAIYVNSVGKNGAGLIK